ncbi:penicillin-binding transpeptidase domain-containing protein [Novosphingobium colocasiae]
MVSRIASGRPLMPSLLLGQPMPDGPALPLTPEQFAVTREGMFRVVNGSGTAGRSRLDLDGIQMAGKTGTAQVAKLVSRGSVGTWKTRDHALFICYAPTDRPRYAMAVVIEHGTFGARAAAPIAKDVMTFLFDPAKAWDLAAEARTVLGRHGAGAPGCPLQFLRVAIWCQRPPRSRRTRPRTAMSLPMCLPMNRRRCRRWCRTSMRPNRCPPSARRHRHRLPPGPVPSASPSLTPATPR